MRVPLLVLVLALTLVAEKPRKAAEVTVSSFSAARKAGVIEMEAALANSGSKPLAGLRVSFQLFTSDHRPLTTQQAAAEEATLNPGEESRIEAQMPDAPGAVRVEVAVTDGAGRELRVGKPGPYDIE